MAKSYSSTIKHNEASYAKKLKKAFVKKKPPVDKPKSAKAAKIEDEQFDFIKDQQYVLSMFPGEPGFLGRNLNYPEVKKSLLKKAQKLNLNKIRHDVANLADQKGVSTSRRELQDLLQKYPFYADLHAIHAIQNYIDILQSGSEKNRLDHLRDNLTEISLALYNDGLSVFNTIWFIKIYSAYLSILSDKLARVHNMTLTTYNPKVRELRDEINDRRYQLLTLATITNKLKPFKRLSHLLKGTPYIINHLSPEEIKGACAAMAVNQPAKKIGEHNMRANYIMHILITLLNLFSSVPILFELVNKVLKHIPENHRDLLLQKRMIITAQGFTEFDLVNATGNNDQASKLADRIHDFCDSTIREHLANAVITKPYEIDPFLKIAYITKLSKPLLNQVEMKKKVVVAFDHMQAATGRRLQYSAGVAAATEMMWEMNKLKAAFAS